MSIVVRLRPEMGRAGIQLAGEPEVFSVHVYETY